MKPGEEFLSLQEMVKLLNNMPQLHYGDLSIDKYVNKRLAKGGALLRPYLLGGKSKILDIGCYAADFLGFLGCQVEYWGIDFDDGALEIAKQKGAKVVKCQLDVDEFPIGDRFDIVVCTEVLEHLVNPIRMVENIKKLMRDDGVALISLPNENTIYHRIMSLIGKGVDLCVFQEFKHLHLPTVKQSEGFISKFFRIIRKDYYINPSARGSRAEWIGRFLTKVPDSVWETSARIFPGLFARGVIFLVGKKERNGELNIE